MAFRQADPRVRAAGRKARFDAKRTGPVVDTGPEVFWMCRRKTRYPDEHAARAGAFHQFEAHTADVFELWTYRCSNCRGWHLTKQPQSGQASITAGDLVTDVWDNALSG